jgi:hypothetical protein
VADRLSQQHVLRDYYEALGLVHDLVRPAVYLEIGVHEGHSFHLASPTVTAVGVDPGMNLQFAAPERAQLFHRTSDAFFAEDATGVFADAPVDLAFLDGLHHWDQTLRDFAHTEQHSDAAGCVLIHDCLPIDGETSTRERTTVVWSGDVWKVIVWLRRHRPELHITTLDVGPTGLAVVTGLDPQRRVPTDDDLDDDLWALGYDDVADELGDLLNVVPGTIEALERAVPAG